MKNEPRMCEECDEESATHRRRSNDELYGDEDFVQFKCQECVLNMQNPGYNFEPIEPQTPAYDWRELEPLRPEQVNDSLVGMKNLKLDNIYDRGKGTTIDVGLIHPTRLRYVLFQLGRTAVFWIELLIGRAGKMKQK